MMYPLLVSAVGLLVCAVTTLVTTDVSTVECTDEIGPILKRQILISTVLMTLLQKQAFVPVPNPPFIPILEPGQ